jgi:hypothetical protein
LNKKIIFAFFIGAATGSLITWKAVKTKYERMAQEQIASMREVMAKKQKTTDEEPKDIHVEIEETVKAHEETMTEYAELINGCGYTNVTRKQANEIIEEHSIYVIPPEEYGEEEGYDCAELTFWSDGVLTDDLDEPIDDIEGTIRYESLKHFGEYEDDSVFVRNELKQMDYQILLDERSYNMAIMEVR